MILETLKSIFKRDLLLLIKEIEQYETESKLWQLENQIQNTAGNLSLHLIGNLNHFIGATLGKTGYIRNRPLEFSDKNVPKTILIQDIQNTIVMIENVLSSIQESDLEKEYPILVFDQKISTMYFLIHLSTHLTYHLGQINYHRRLLHETL
jgi:uncharacterized damage-inducible protein DinB